MARSVQRCGIATRHLVIRNPVLVESLFDPLPASRRLDPRRVARVENESAHLPARAQPVLLAEFSAELSGLACADSPEPARFGPLATCDGLDCFFRPNFQDGRH